MRDPVFQAWTFSLPFLCLALTGCEVEMTPAQLERIANEKARAEAKAQDRSEVASDPLGTASKVDPNMLTLTKRASLEAERGNDDKAIALIEQALTDDPKDREALQMLARAAQHRANSLKRPESSPYYLKTAEAVRKLKAFYPRLSRAEMNQFPVVFYNEACTLALNGEGDKAVQALTEAVESGFNRVGTLETDHELDGIRDRPEVQVLIRKAEERSVDDQITFARKFKFDFKLPDAEGKTVSLSGLRPNTKLFVVTLWGTWFAPSRKQIPQLQTIDAQFRDKGVKVVAINYEREEGDAGKKAIVDYVKENHVPFPCLIGDEATRKQVYEFRGYPTTILVTPNGTAQLKFDGYQSAATIEIALNKLLEAAAKPPAK